MIELVAAILVDLSEQKLYVLRADNTVIRTLVVSTGKPSTPTPPGTYRVLTKYEQVDLTGPGYRIPTRHVMCFTPSEGYCIHPTPPSNSTVGTPLSLGCVRTKHADAKWLFDRTATNTPVTVQP